MRQSKKASMYALVKIWQTNGQSKTDFCKSQSIKLPTFSYWVDKYESEQALKTSSTAGGNFIPLTIEQPLERGKIEIAYPNGIRLHLTGSVSSSYLKELINLLPHV